MLLSTSNRRVFNKLCEWLESSEKLLTLTELTQTAQTFATSDTQIYSEKWLKHKLTKRYGDHVFFAEVSSRRNVVCFRNMASYIINDKWYADRLSNMYDKAKRVVVATDKLVRSEIREANYRTDTYLSRSSISSLHRATQWLTQLLRDF